MKWIHQFGLIRNEVKPMTRDWTEANITACSKNYTFGRWRSQRCSLVLALSLPSVNHIHWHWPESHADVLRHCMSDARLLWLTRSTQVCCDETFSTEQDRANRDDDCRSDKPECARRTSLESTRDPRQLREQIFARSRWHTYRRWNRAHYCQHRHFDVLGNGRGPRL